MTQSFSDLKRGSAKNFDKLNEELSKLNKPSYDKSDDTRLWKCQQDKVGNGYAVIRFLPAPAGEDMPFVQMFTHGFQGPGGYYIENSLTTLGGDKIDPVAELNKQLWNSGVEANKEIARKQKRKLNYYSNIYVIKDPANPKNEGKVFLFKYGKKIFDKLNYLMNPEFEDDEPINPFDLWTGATFKLKIRNYEGYANYDKSEFEKAGPLSDDDEELERIWKQEYSLKEILDPKNFKSYEVLKARLDKVLGAAAQAKPAREEYEDSYEEETPAPKAKAKAAPAAAASSDDEDDDDLEFFKKLRDDDDEIPF